MDNGGNQLINLRMTELRFRLPVLSENLLAKFRTPSINEEKTDLFCSSLGPGDFPVDFPGDFPGEDWPSSNILPSSIDNSRLFFTPIASSLLAEGMRSRVFLRDMCSAEALNLNPPFGAPYLVSVQL